MKEFSNEEMGNEVVGNEVRPKSRFPLFLHFFISSFFLLSGCASVSALDRGCLEDKDMELSASMSDSYGDNVMLYREGASGGSAGKTGGGCGCN